MYKKGEIIQHQPKNTNTRKRRIPNMFMMFRKERMKYRMPNVPMKEFSKLVSQEWKNLSEREKTELQRKYHINRDENLPKTAHGSFFVIDLNYSTPKAELENVANIGPDDNKLPAKLIKDVFLTESPSDDFLNNNEDIKDINIIYKHH